MLRAEVSSVSKVLVDANGESSISKETAPMNPFFDALGRWLFGSLAVASILVAGGLVMAVGARIWRVETSRLALKNLGANVQWVHESREIRLRQNIKPLRLAAKLLGNATVSELGVVDIANGDAGDDELSCIDSLHGVQRLRLISDRASDQTLGRISRLPSLEFLAAVGQRFTVQGLLQLRMAGQLKELTIAANHYSPIELAVLHSALRGVTIKEMVTEDEQTYVSPPSHSSHQLTLPLASKFPMDDLLEPIAFTDRHRS